MPVQVVAESAPWRHVTKAERTSDGFALYAEVPAECGTFVALTRGVADDLRFGLRLPVRAAAGGGK